MPTIDKRRPLELDSLDAVMAEANRLLESGYRAEGKWTLGQTCVHLAEWARFPMDGFPRPPLFVRAIFGVMKALGMTEKMKQSILSQGFKPGTPTAPQTVPAADAVEDAAGVQQLGQVFDKIKTYDGPLHPSPLFGEMDREMWVKVTVLHAQHHLAFLVPQGN